MSVTELKEWHEVTFLSALQEENILPQSTAHNILRNVSELLHSHIQTLKDAVREGLQADEASISVDHIDRVFQSAINTGCFTSVKSTTLHDNKYLTENCKMIPPHPYVIGKVRVWSKEGRVISQEVNAYIVPFLEDLESLLNNKDVLECVENPREHIPGIFNSLLDGNCYRHSADFRVNSKALAIILYFDEVEFCNPLGSKKRKLGMYYYILVNIYPELRSTVRVINLYAIVDSHNLKRFGHKSVLKPFIDDLKELKRGVNLMIHGREKFFSGFLLGVVGDTPASNSIAGQKEGVGAAHRPCRKCLVEKNQLKEVSTEEEVTLRNKDLHEQHLARVTNPRLSLVNKRKWSTLYGVNERSCLLDIDDFDVTEGFPQDTMHVVHEGVLEAQCRNFIRYCVEREDPLFSLDDLNNALKCFKYGHLIKDKPSPIENQHLQNGLRQSAAQMITLGFVLPFAIYQWLDDSVDDHIRNFISLIQIVNMLSAFTLTSKEIVLLKKMIEMYIITYLHLYPTASATPKLHYLIHLPEQIRQYGPPRQHWCFRFEAAHQYYKSLASKVKNFKNLPKTLSERKQRLKCVQLVTPNNTGSKKFLYFGHDIKSGKILLVQQHAYRDAIIAGHPIPAEGRVMVSPRVTVHGTVYRKNSVLLLKDSEDELPLFGLVDEIIVFDRTIYLCYEELTSKNYDEYVNAYIVVKTLPIKKCVIAVSDLLHPHSLSIFKCVGKCFVILLYYKRTEFTG